MNVLTIFEQRIGAIFEEDAPGEKKPISFKRLAKRAVREMEDETFVIDGVDTAPALYTILVASQDDVVMRPLYARICEEISQLIEAQAKKRGYTFVGKPLVRFMVDPALRHGKISVFAENIDPRTLARLRDEENAYLGITPATEPYMDQAFIAEPATDTPNEFASVAPAAQDDGLEAMEAAEPEGALDAFENLPEDDGLEAATDDDQAGEDDGSPDADGDTFAAEEGTDIESDTGAEPEEDLIEREVDAILASAGEAPADDALAEDADDGILTDVPTDDGVADDDTPLPAPEAPAPVAAPAVPPFIAENPGQTSAIPKISPADPDEPHAAPQAPSCTLTDLATGKVYHLTEARVAAGRERTPGALVLTDPNVSRRHAEFSFDGVSWHVRDLGSTNGTLVNDIDVPAATLRNDDVVTLGVTDLQFRAG